VLGRSGFFDRIVKTSVLFICSIGIGICVFNFSNQNFRDESRLFGNDKEKEFVAIIDEIPVESEYTLSARAEVNYGYVLLRIEKGSVIQYGDKLLVKAKCEIPEPFDTNTGTTFNYKRYLMARYMHHVCKVKSFEIIEKDSGNYIHARLYELRLWFSGHVDGAFDDPHAGLIKGVLLGDKSGLSPELKSDMTVAGVIHIAVLSGSNIAMVAGIIFGLSKSFPYNIRILLSVCIVVLFVLLSGAEPPAVRAGVLVVIMFMSKFLHRTLHTGRALLTIAVIMVFWNPFALVYDMSFHLSFLATIGIVYVAPLMEVVFKRVTERFGLREVLAGTLGAQVVVTPLILYATGALSIVSLPANVLIGWAVPVLMGIGFFGGLFHVISGFLAMPVVFLAEVFSGYIVSITKVSAHIPYAQILLPLNHPLLLCAMYIGLFFTLRRLKIYSQKVSS
jgi:competence protein ComEC